MSQFEKLAKALQAGAYDAAPGKLRQGCISFISDHPLTEQELDALWAATFGDQV